jgi:hypothetical protein
MKYVSVDVPCISGTAIVARPVDESPFGSTRSRETL